MTPFDLLGLSAEASLDEIKRAYRRQAMRWHPDRNAHPEATERFKAIRAAYDQLLSGERGDPAPEDSPPEPEAPPQDAAASPRAEDIRLEIELTLAEAYCGCEKNVGYARGRPCATCDGSGEAGLSRSRLCDACHGSGRIHSGVGGLSVCTACNGRGFLTQRTCSDCAGSGRDSEPANLHVQVPAGMLHSDELRLKGQGELGDDELLPGDLYLRIVLLENPLFALRGRDLLLSMPVSALAMLAGGEIAIPLPGGATLKHMLSAMSPEQGEIRLAGQGMPARGRLRAGDLILNLTPVFPAHLDGKARKLLLQADALLADDEAVFPELRRWREAHGLG